MEQAERLDCHPKIKGVVSRSWGQMLWRGQKKKINQGQFLLCVRK